MRFFTRIIIFSCDISSKMPGLDRNIENKDSAQYCGRKNPIPKVGKGSGILDENGVS